jgi:opacity protein-like surface antigen
MYKISLLLLLVVLLPSLVAAQDENKDGRRVEFFGGYSYLVTDTKETDDPIDHLGNLDGFNVAATYYITKRFGITGDFSAHFGKTTQDITGGTISFNSKSFNFFVGPQYKFTNKTRVTPFVHALAGISNNRFSYRAIATGATTPAAEASLSITDFALAIGGGLDVRVNKRVSIRAFQIDYSPVFVQSRPQFGIDGGRRFDNVRFSIGIVFK